MPVGFSLLCVLLGIVLLRWSRKAGVGFVLAGVLVLYLFSIAPVAKTLMRTLEVGYPAVAIAELPQADAIVVLGGGTGSTMRASCLKLVRHPFWWLVVEMYFQHRVAPEMPKPPSHC